MTAYKLLQSSTRIEFRVALNQIFNQPVSELARYVRVRGNDEVINVPTHRNADGVDSETNELIDVVLGEPGRPE